MTNTFPILRLTDVSASYGSRRVIEGVSLSVQPHDFLGIVGPNGGGKTTLVKIMLGLKRPDEGRVEYFRDGQPVDHITLGYLPQYSHVDRQFPITVREVVLSGLSNKKGLFSAFTSNHKDMVDEALHRLSLTSFADRHIGALSGGQLQRVLLARAIVSRPEILVLDEPNTYMDRHFQKDMYALLHVLNEHCAVVIVSHDLDAVKANACNVAYVDGVLKYNEPNIDL